MSTMFTVFRKEMTDALRDRRTVFIALVMGPLLFPLLFMGLGSFAAKKQTEKLEKPLELPVVGAEHAPNLVRWLKGQGVIVQAPPADADRAVREQEHGVILSIPAAYPEQWRKSEPARVDLVLDSSRALESGATIARVERLLAMYDREVGTLRLVARGVHPALGSPLAVARRDLATPESKAGLQLMMMPYLLILLGFIGGMHLAIDTTAGERERQSLEPLLATPVSRTAIMSGKLAATVTFALLSLGLTFVTFKLSTLFGGSGKMSFDLPTAAAAQAFLVVLPVVLFGSALLTLLAAFAKSYREAQSYLSLVFLLPMIPTMLLMVNPVKTKLWMLAVPFLGQNQMIMKVLRGEGTTAVEWAVVLGAGLVLAAIFWGITARLYHREQLAISG
jgi:sodium transport system permease protein